MKNTLSFSTNAIHLRTDFENGCGKEGWIFITSEHQDELMLHDGRGQYTAARYPDNEMRYLTSVATRR